MNVFILTEGGEHRGMGHLVRCLAVVQAFAARGIVPTAICRGEMKPAAFGEFKETARVETWDWLKDSARLGKIIENADIVLVDSYEAPRSFYSRIARNSRLGVYFDDTKRIRYPKGIVINAAAGAEELRYAGAASVRYLLGCRYFPLRKAFWASPARAIRRDIRTILLTLGGSDPGGFAPRLLDYLRISRPALKKIVVVGPRFGRTDDLRAAADGRTIFLKGPNAPAVRKAMRAADVAISAAGQTLYELARMGTPTISISAAANQRTNVKGLSQAGFLEHAGPGASRGLIGRVDRALGILNDAGVRRQRSLIGRALVPGDGALKIVDAVLKTYLVSRMTLRRFEERDAQGIFLLSNQPDVRKSSFHRRPIMWAVHQAWFRKKLADRNSLCLAAEIDGVLCGQVRFEVRDDRAWVSISVSRDFRGTGLGKDVVRRGIVLLREAFPRVKTVVAQIRPENDASIGFFKSCGFTFGGGTSAYEQEAVEYLFALEGGRS